VKEVIRRRKISLRTSNLLMWSSIRKKYWSYNQRSKDKKEKVNAKGRKRLSKKKEKKSMKKKWNLLTKKKAKNRAKLMSLTYQVTKIWVLNLMTRRKRGWKSKKRWKNLKLIRKRKRPKMRKKKKRIRKKIKVNKYSKLLRMTRSCLRKVIIIAIGE